MLNNLLNLLFGCSHRRTTFPITPARRAGYSQSRGQRHSTYVVCLDCGKEFGYDWSEMHIGDPVAAPVTAEAAFSTAPR
ncbi:MAG TPA: hypothetical protein VMG35_10370 [Bryobacteraceae bacterium]|nr:hypothetical protein [Bryobacteraceae bacterium]